MDDTKFNTILSQPGAPVLHIEIDRVISADGYAENFLPKLEEMVEKHGEIRILIHYKDYKGWEVEAAKQDMFFSVIFAKQIAKLALVNPPEAEVFQRTIKKSMTSGEIKLFNASNLEDAKKWVAE